LKFFPSDYADASCRGGEELFALTCELDLEGIVAKHKFSPYISDGDQTSWLKIRNRSYSQWKDRAELFERERKVVPDENGWDACARVAAASHSR
jgi:hypothetical protein